MDTTKRMWSEEQIGEIAKANGSKLYRHHIRIAINSSVSPSGDDGKLSSIAFDFYSSQAEKFTSLSEVQATYNYINHSYSFATGNVIYKSDSTEQTFTVSLLISGGNDTTGGSITVHYIPTTHMTKGWIAFYNANKAIKTFTDTVMEV